MCVCTFSYSKFGFSLKLILTFCTFVAMDSFSIYHSIALMSSHNSYWLLLGNFIFIKYSLIVFPLLWLSIYLTICFCAGVGKTSIVLRYVGKVFSNRVNSTIGASFFTFTM